MLVTQVKTRFLAAEVKVKRLNNLFEQITTLDNLRLADKKARRGKLKSYGVQKHIQNSEENLQQLLVLLKEGTFKTSSYDIFNLVTDAGKERKIYRLPYYPDRILHHAIMNILEPVWMSIFTADTYSCIKGRGIHGVVRNLKKALKDKQETKYCLKLDIKKFYPTVKHSVLKTLLRKKIKDIRLLSMLDEIIDSAPGIPIGNYLSQFFANIYLAYLDHWLKEVYKVKYYFRYADDFVILHKSKQFLQYLRCEIESYLQNKLQLQLKENWQVFPVNSRGIDFVGYVFRHSHVLLRKTIKIAWARKAVKVHKREQRIHISKQELCSYTGWALHCNAITLQRKLA